jgi:hypothetical protein
MHTKGKTTRSATDLIEKISGQLAGKAKIVATKDSIVVDSIQYGDTIATARTELSYSTKESNTVVDTLTIELDSER